MQAMKKILVFIDTSLGELDWISPFLTSKYAKDFKITILFRKNILTQQLIEDHALDVDNIMPLNVNDVFCDNKLIDTFWRFSKSLQKRSSKFPGVYNYINHFRTYLIKKTKTKTDISRYQNYRNSATNLILFLGTLDWEIRKSY